MAFFMVSEADVILVAPQTSRVTEPRASLAGCGKARSPPRILHAVAGNDESHGTARGSMTQENRVSISGFVVK